MNIGFIGLGIMGSRMAGNLLQAGHTLIVHNRSQEKGKQLVAKGAIWAATPAAAAAQSDMIITMLPHPDAVTAVLTGEDGLLSGLQPGNLWIDSTTTHPSFARHLAKTAHASGIRFLEAPVAGSKNQAAGAQLVFFVGGEAADVAEATPLFEQMGQRVVHVGPHGMGISLKVVINHLLGTSMAAFAEALTLGQSLGLPREQLLNILVGGVVVPPYMGSKKEMLLADQYEPEFPLRWMQKDMHMVATAAYEQGIPMPLANLTKELFQTAIQIGRGDDDFSAIAAN